MTLSRDIKAIVGRIDVAVAAGDSFGRVDLDRLRRELNLIASDAAQLEEREKVECIAFGMLADGIEKSIGQQRSLLRRSRDRKAGAVAQVAAS